MAGLFLHPSTGEILNNDRRPPNQNATVVRRNLGPIPGHIQMYRLVWKAMIAAAILCYICFQW